MELIYFGDKAKINKLLILVIPTLLLLNYLNIKFLASVNIFGIVMIIFFIVISFLFLKKLLLIYQSKNFTEYLYCEFQRSKLLTIFTAIMLMAYSLFLISEKEIFFNEFNLLFFQRSISVLLFGVCLLNITIFKDLLYVKFLDYNEKINGDNIINFENYNTKQEVFDLHKFILNSESKYLGVTFSNQYDYYKIGGDLFDFKFITNKNNDRESVIQDFTNFIEGRILNQELFWIDKNTRGGKEVTYSSLVLLLKCIELKTKESRSKFIKTRLISNMKFFGKEANVGAIKTAFSTTRTSQYTNRHNIIFDIVKRSKKD